MFCRTREAKRKVSAHGLIFAAVLVPPSYCSGWIFLCLEFWCLERPCLNLHSLSELSTSVSAVNSITLFQISLSVASRIAYNSSLCWSLPDTSYWWRNLSTCCRTVRCSSACEFEITENNKRAQQVARITGSFQTFFSQ